MQDNNKPSACGTELGHDGLPFATEPLRWLAKHLHSERTLRDNVSRLRWKRRRPAAAKPVVEVQP